MKVLHENLLKALLGKQQAIKCSAMETNGVGGSGGGGLNQNTYRMSIGTSGM